MDPLTNPALPFFDPAGLREELTSCWREIPRNAAQVRARVLPRLKDLKAQVRSEARAFLERTGDGRACATALASFQDELVKLIYDFSTFHIYLTLKSTTAGHMALVATGGYGRGLLAPGSDIDLLFLFPNKQTAQAESIVKSVLHYLWDLGYKVGHAVRTIDQTIKAAKDDMTVRTALLDARLIHGESALFNRMQVSFISSVVQGSQREFIEAKLRERAERLKRTGFSRYMVEPNIKEGKGGLRDLNTLHWIAVYLNPGSNGQAEKEFFRFGETETFDRCESFLWTVRCYLHFLAGRPEERLSFDAQPEMARQLRYHGRKGLLGVERFMKHYFLVAKDVGDLTRTVCSCLEIRQLKTVPTLSDFVGTLPWGSRAKLAATTDFRVDNSRLNVKQPDVFTKNPLNLIRFFVESERNSLLPHPQAVRLIRSWLKLIDDSFKSDPQANQLFLELLTSRNAPETSLRALNEAGVLGRFIPDFGRVVAMAEFSMYHCYTIDEHTIRAVGILSQMEKGALADELPLATEIFSGIQNRRALYLALLMHDVAKAVEGDHSIAGAELARKLAFRMGFKPGEADTAAWLVEHHLAMSQTAQSRDISDPQTVRKFADIVQSPERLKLLLLLTVADIRAVGPGVWNGWKGQLLRSLYYDTEPLLAGGHTREPRKSRIISAQARLREALAGWPPAEIERFIQRQEPDYWLKTNIERQVQHAKLIRAFESERPVVAFDAKSDEFRSLTELTLVTGVKGDTVQPFTELTLVTQDTPRLLMIFAGACAAAGANIASAQISTTRDGLALDTLFLQRLFSDGQEIERAQKISHTISDILSGKRAIETLETACTLQKSWLGAFSVTPDVIIDNTASQELTVIEVHALDRPGLLFDLARGLSDLGLDIASAHIATFGEKAVDVFYVRDRFRKKVVSGDAKRLIRERLLSFDPHTTHKEEATTLAGSATLTLHNKQHELPVISGTLGPNVIDFSKLYSLSGDFTYDPGFASTVACKSGITYLDGERGVLFYRGYPIEQLAEHGNFLETCHLLLYGQLPNKQQYLQFVNRVTYHTMIHEQMNRFFSGFRRDAHPMAVMAAAVGALSAFYHNSIDINNPVQRDLAAIRMIAKMPTIAATAFKYSIGQPFMYPRNHLDYSSNFLYMMFGMPCEEYKVNPVLARALDRILILHADHEQNASTSTVRLAGSSGANPFACIAAGIACLWGPAHGAANEAALKMLMEIRTLDRIPEFIKRAKDKNDNFRLSGFGHRVYKNYDPRARVMQKTCKEVLNIVGIKNDPLLQVAMELERIALEDEYFIEKKLYPNIDFYSGITLKALGFPTSMFTVLFAVGRTVGWIAQWKEMISDPEQKIGCQRQLYIGEKPRDYVPLELRP